MPAELDTKFGPTIVRTGTTFNVAPSVTGAITANADAITAEATARANADTALGVLVSAAQDDATAALFELGTESASIRHLYVDPVAGLDVNDGSSTALAIQTYARLLELLPAVISQPHLVHGTSGVLDIGTQPIPYTCGTRLLGFYADDAWDPRGDLYTVVASGVTATGTTAHQIVSGSALTLNAHRGYVIRITSGALAGQKRTVLGNSTTTYFIATSFGSAAVDGSTYEILQNNFVISTTAGSPFTTSGNTSDPTAGVVFVGTDFDSPTAADSAYFGQNYHQFIGCRVRPNLLSTVIRGNGTLDCGNANPGLLAQLGLNTTTQAPSGCSLAVEGGGITVEFGRLLGRPVVKGTSFLTSTCRAQITGGFFEAISTAGAPSIALSGTSTNKIRLGDATQSGTALAMAAGSGYATLANVDLNMSSATNPAISIERGAACSIASTVTGSNANASGLSVRVRRRGEMDVSGLPAFGKAGVADWQCEGTSAIAATALNAADTRIANASFPESVIRRGA